MGGHSVASYSPKLSPLVLLTSFIQMECGPPRLDGRINEDGYFIRPQKAISKLSKCRTRHFQWGRALLTNNPAIKNKKQDKPANGFTLSCNIPVVPIADVDRVVRASSCGRQKEMFIDKRWDDVGHRMQKFFGFLISDFFRRTLLGAPSAGFLHYDNL